MYRAANSRPPATAAYQDKQEIRTCKRPCSGKLPPASRGREAAYAAPSETSAARCFFRTACAILMKRDTGCSKQPPQYKKAPTLPDRHTGPVWRTSPGAAARRPARNTALIQQAGKEAEQCNRRRGRVGRFLCPCAAMDAGHRFVNEFSFALSTTFHMLLPFFPCFFNLRHFYYIFLSIKVNPFMAAFESRSPHRTRDGWCSAYKQPASGFFTAHAGRGFADACIPLTESGAPAD